MNYAQKYTIKATRALFVAKQDWKLETVPPEISGLTRAIQVYRTTRRSDLITHKYFGDRQTYCPPLWWDVAIGSGACGLGCRACFLMLTFRAMRDPMRHVLYDNVEDFWKATKKWLSHPKRRPKHTLGLGIDRSDSLLYEGVTHHIKHLAPMFANPTTNPNHNRLILLTKTTNVQYLECVPTKNIVVTFSLNPEPIADLWEGKWPDTGLRITPPIKNRLEACLLAQKMGFETRFRIDPILYPAGWKAHYEDFFKEAASLNLRPHVVTLGTYREKNAQLDTWRAKWGLPPMEWEPENLEKDGTHRHIPEASRIEIYRNIANLIQKYLPQSHVALCKETHAIRRELGLCSSTCNCLVSTKRLAKEADSGHFDKHKGGCSNKKRQNKRGGPQSGRAAERAERGIDLLQTYPDEKPNTKHPRAL